MRRDDALRLLSALLSTALETLQGTSPFGHMPWSEVVRRQGLEPRTRGLREEPGRQVAALVSRSARPPLSVEVGPGVVAGLYGWLYVALANLTPRT
jgi:hypothetical protein